MRRQIGFAVAAFRNEAGCTEAGVSGMDAQELLAVERESDVRELHRARVLTDWLVAAYHQHFAPVGSQEAEVPADYMDLLVLLPDLVWIALAKHLDVSLIRARTRAKNALAVTASLPQLRGLVVAGAVRFGRLDYAAGRASHLPWLLRETFDGLVAELDASWEWKRWKKAVDDIYDSLMPPKDRAEAAHRERRVAFWNNGDGTASLQFVGPVATVSAAHCRLSAWARGIRLGQKGDFAVGLEPGAVIDDRRTLDQLCFDIGVLGIPEIPVGMRRADGTHGTFLLTLPTDSAWLRAQAGVNVTIPLLSLMGCSQLPGRLDDASPLSAADARRIAAHSPSLRRLVTDPVTGTVLEAVAQTYAIPASLRTTLTARWQWCTVPGCTRKAVACDIDHIIPFNKGAPASGGTTVFDNLHPLCRHHHNLKTNGVLAVERVSPRTGRGETGPVARWRSVDEGALRWTFPAALGGAVGPPGSRIETEHARELAELQELIDGSVMPASAFAGIGDDEEEPVGTVRTAPGPGQPTTSKPPGGPGARSADKGEHGVEVRSGKELRNGPELWNGVELQNSSELRSEPEACSKDERGERPGLRRMGESPAEPDIPKTLERAERPGTSSSGESHPETVPGPEPEPEPEPELWSKSRRDARPDCQDEVEQPTGPSERYAGGCHPGREAPMKQDLPVDPWGRLRSPFSDPDPPPF